MSNEIRFASRWDRSRFMPKPDNVLVVAKKGRAHARTITEALAMVENPSSDNPWVIQVAPGIYKERFTLPNHTWVVGMASGLFWGSVVIELPDASGPLITVPETGCGLQNLVLHVATDMDYGSSDFNLVLVTGFLYTYKVNAFFYGDNGNEVALLMLDGGYLRSAMSLWQTSVTGASLQSSIRARNSGGIFEVSDYVVTYGTAKAIFVESTAGTGRIVHTHVKTQSGNIALQADGTVWCEDFTWENGTVQGSGYHEEQLASDTRHGWMSKEKFAQLNAGSGISGTFTTNDGKTITVQDGIITQIA